MMARAEADCVIGFHQPANDSGTCVADPDDPRHVDGDSGLATVGIRPDGRQLLLTAVTNLCFTGHVEVRETPAYVIVYAPTENCDGSGTDVLAVPQALESPVADRTVAIAGSGRTLPTSHVSTDASAHRRREFSADGGTFAYPGPWTLTPGSGATVAVLSTEPVRGCAAGNDECWATVAPLPPDGILVTLRQTYADGRRITDLPGKAEMLGGRALRTVWDQALDSDCAHAPGTVTEARAAVVKEHRSHGDVLWEITVCAGRESDVNIETAMKMFWAISFDTPR